MVTFRTGPTRLRYLPLPFSLLIPTGNLPVPVVGPVSTTVEPDLLDPRRLLMDFGTAAPVQKGPQGPWRESVCRGRVNCKSPRRGGRHGRVDVPGSSRVSETSIIYRDLSFDYKVYLYRSN